VPAYFSKRGLGAARGQRSRRLRATQPASCHRRSGTDGVGQGNRVDHRRDGLPSARSASELNIKTLKRQQGTELKATHGLRATRKILYV
jgi:hypothetical protein